MDEGTGSVHTYDARDPHAVPPAGSTATEAFFNVMVTGYEAVHSIHSSYYFLLLTKIFSSYRR